MCAKRHKKTPTLFGAWERLQEPCHKFADLVSVNVHNDASILLHLLLSAVWAFPVSRIPRDKRVLTATLRAFEKWEMLVQVTHFDLHHVLALLATELHNHA